MRTAFIEELLTQAQEHQRLFLTVGDLGYSVVEPFARRFPNRFLNAGVAEQNMTGVAAGLASEGWHVFTYSIANFSTLRCFEQIRNDVAYHGLSVTIVAVGGGLAYGNLGYSHHAVQDYAVMRSLPQMLVAAPGDPLETRAVVQWLGANPQPSYLRLGKAGEPTLHASMPAVAPGRLTPVVHRSGGKTFLTTGAALRYAVGAANHPSLGGTWAVHSLPLWGEQWKAQIANELDSFEAIIAAEDHLGPGGFCSYLRELLPQHLLSRLRTVSLDIAVTGRVGSQEVLNEAAGLSVNRLVALATALE